MNEKLLLQDLVDLLSKKAKITKKDADSFYRELFQLILERLFDNDIVKIKDFGTFKLVSVSSRESVNVNTGEKIEIPSHYKLSFVPDKVLKTLVNKPFSQFETILLEDGVVFETSVDDEEDVSEDVVVPKDAGVVPEKEDTLVVEKSKPQKAETVSKEVAEETIKKEEKEKKNSTPTITHSYPKSFVYTYTISETEQKDSSITLTIPKEDLILVKSSEKEKIVFSEETETEKAEFAIELKDLPSIPSLEDVHSIDDLSEDDEVVTVDTEIVVDNDEGGEIDKVLDLDTNNNFSKENLISDSLLSEDKSLNEPLLEHKIFSKGGLELGTSFVSEIETEEDIVVPMPIVDPIEELDESPQVELSKEKKVSSLNDDPSRPLFPTEDDDILDFIPLEGYSEIESDKIDGNESVVNTYRSAGNNKPAETRQVSFSDTIDSVDISYPDYSDTSTSSKVKKWLPIILFVLVIAGFLTYGLVQMLQKPYDYEYHLGRADSSLADTSVLDVQAQETDALLDSMKQIQKSYITDSSERAKEELSPVNQKSDVHAKVEPTSAIVGSADSLTTDFLNAEKDGLVISNNLRFSMLNKAEYHLGKYMVGKKISDVNSADQAEVKEFKNQYATIKRGTTLRTMAATYYGNPTYWVYIYQANRRNISNPNNVPVGTRLLIPSLSDYGVSNSKDSKAIQAAKSLESKILRGG